MWIKQGSSSDVDTSQVRYLLEDPEHFMLTPPYREPPAFRAIYRVGRNPDSYFQCTIFSDGHAGWRVVFDSQVTVSIAYNRHKDVWSSR